MENEKVEQLFWSDKIAKSVMERKKYMYIDKEIPEFSAFNVKTSASLSGVLHIGRLSDTIRGESVVKSIKDAGCRSDFIWVAEDMDPLRKIPKCVPSTFDKYIGMPVTDIPDPWGCHKTYAEHHFDKYLKVLFKFTGENIAMYSMRDEYRKGNFSQYIKKLVENSHKIVDIQNKYRDNKLPQTWSPWTPICRNCGKIITAKVTGFDGKQISYKCQDYHFEKTVAKGCGFEGVADPLKDEGKLMWKSEWAAQWARWGIVSEGAGKEYQVPGSAFWINAEIAETILDFPAPEPIFYEHITIDGKKMSASVGNIVYPHEWLEVAEPEVMRFLYNKKLMKTRSFSWKDLPRLYDDYDMHMKVFFGIEKTSNEKEAIHMKRLFEISQIKVPEHMPAVIPYDFAVVISQIFSPEESIDRAVSLLKSTGHIGDLTDGDMEYLKKRMVLARNWGEKHADESMRIKINETIRKETMEKLSNKQVDALRELAKSMDSIENEKELYSKFFEISRSVGIDTKDFFRAAYLVLIRREQGPRLAPFIFAIGKSRVKNLLKGI